jgi:hypothetical protein
MLKIGLVSFWESENSGACFDHGNSTFSTESSWILLKSLKNYLLKKNIMFDSYKKFNFNEIDLFIYRDLPINWFLNKSIIRSKKKKILWQNEIWHLRHATWNNIDRYSFDGIISWKYCNHPNVLKINAHPFLPANLMTRSEFKLSLPLAMVNSNRTLTFNCGYQLRQSFIKNSNGLIDLYGKGWDRKRFAEDSILKYLNSRHFDNAFRISPPECFKGTIRNKSDIKNKYKAHLVVENFYENDYITEKIWDVLALGSIPVYKGPPNLYDIFDISNKFFIDLREFNEVDDLLNYINHLSYEEYNSFFNNFLKFTQVDNIFNKDLTNYNIYKFIINMHQN